MENLLNRLPKELRDIILEYNVNHRPLFKNVLNQLTETDNKCRYCDVILTNEKYYGLYIYTWNMHNYIYCGPECGEAGDHDAIKARRRWLNRLAKL